MKDIYVMLTGVLVKEKMYVICLIIQFQKINLKKKQKYITAKNVKNKYKNPTQKIQSQYCIKKLNENLRLLNR